MKNYALLILVATKASFDLFTEGRFFACLTIRKYVKDDRKKKTRMEKLSFDLQSMRDFLEQLVYRVLQEFEIEVIFNKTTI